MENQNNKSLLVLAGGFGTRLKSVIKDVPKPLAPVNNIPFISYLIDNWIAQGIHEMVFLLYHQANLIEEFLAEKSKEIIAMNCNIKALIEPKPLGTGGAVAFAVEQLSLSNSFLVANADTWLESGTAEMFATESPAMGVVKVENASRYGQVIVDENNKVVKFEEKKDNAVGNCWINAGIYHLHPSLFHKWYGKPFSLERDLFPQIVQSGNLCAVLLLSTFIDIGIPEDYEKFCHGKI